MKNIFAFLVVLSGNCVAADISKTLCEPGERVYFSCAIKGKVASVCGSKVIDQDSGYLQYRFGFLNKVPELVFPQQRVHPREGFQAFQADSPQTFLYELNFSVHDYMYSVFISTAARAPSDGYGVSVRRNNKNLRTYSCDSSIFEDRDALVYLYTKNLIPRSPN
jgi:hypothetical protein